MKVVQSADGNYHLTAETDCDRDFLDDLDIEGLHAAVRVDFLRTRHEPGCGYRASVMTLAVNHKHPKALEAQTARQLLRAVRELFRLGLGEDALNSHIGLDAPNPQTQDKIAAVFKQLQLVLEIGAIAVGQPKPARQEVHSTHGVSSSETAMVGQQGGAA